MPYDKTLDPTRTLGAGRTTLFGRKGKAVVKSDTVDMDPYCKIFVTGEGTLLVLPVENTDGEWVDYGTALYGTIPAHDIRRVKESSTATCITIEASNG